MKSCADIEVLITLIHNLNGFSEKDNSQNDIYHKNDQVFEGCTDAAHLVNGIRDGIRQKIMYLHINVGRHKLYCVLNYHIEKIVVQLFHGISAKQQQTDHKSGELELKVSGVEHEIRKKHLCNGHKRNQYEENKCFGIFTVPSGRKDRTEEIGDRP